MNFVKGEKVRVEDGFGKYYAYFNFIFDNSK